MGNSDSWKPGSRQPGGNPPPASPAAASSKPTPPAEQASESKATGRVIHDERGNAVWDWVKDTARIAIDSTTRLLMRLEVPELQVEDTEKPEQRTESERDPGGGYDPYGGSASTSNRTSGARGAGSPGVSRGAADSAGPRRGTFGNRSATGGDRSKTPNNVGGGYDPYGKGVTSKPTRKP